MQEIKTGQEKMPKIDQAQNKKTTVNEDAYHFRKSKVILRQDIFKLSAKFLLIVLDNEIPRKIILKLVPLFPTIHYWKNYFNDIYTNDYPLTCF